MKHIASDLTNSAASVVFTFITGDLGDKRGDRFLNFHSDSLTVLHMKCYII
jgi:hypothetical protein